VAARIKKQLLDEFNLHTVVRLGEGIFAPYTDIPCNLLFFDHGAPTQEVWYYELLPPDERKKYSKTKPIQSEEFADLKAWWPKRVENENAWKVPRAAVLTEDGPTVTVNLDLKNPNRKDEFAYQEPATLIAALLAKEAQVAQLMKEIENEIVAVSYEE